MKATAVTQMYILTGQAVPQMFIFTHPAVPQTMAKATPGHHYARLISIRFLTDLLATY